MYLQRYMPHLPAGGEIAIFDRSWYNRAGVERIMGFCTDEQAERFLTAVPLLERAIVDEGILLIKYWLEVSAEEQARRLQDRIDDPRKVWKLSPIDLASYTKWDEYTKARDAMFSASNTAWAPWWVVPSDDTRRARLAVIRHLLGAIPYKATKLDPVELPKRKIDRKYERPRNFPTELDVSG